MRFIIDAHLPKSLSKTFFDLGYQTIHTLDMPNGNATSDQEIILAAKKDGVVVSKDEDFYQSFLLKRKPPKLVLVKVGNMKLQA